jgi:CHAD domain-containing protein
MLAKQFKKVKKRGRHFERLDDEARHQLRIACKTLRYTAEIFGSFFGRHKLKSFIALLKPLQDDLGELNDIRTAHELLESQRLTKPVAAAANEVLGWWDREAVTCNDTAAKHLGKLLNAPHFWAK